MIQLGLLLAGMSACSLEHWLHSNNILLSLCNVIAQCYLWVTVLVSTLSTVTLSYNQSSRPCANTWAWRRQTPNCIRRGKYEEGEMGGRLETVFKRVFGKGYCPLRTRPFNISELQQVLFVPIWGQIDLITMWMLWGNLLAGENHALEAWSSLITTSESPSSRINNQ